MSSPVEFTRQDGENIAKTVTMVGHINEQLLANQRGDVLFRAKTEKMWDDLNMRIMLVEKKLDSWVTRVLTVGALFALGGFLLNAFINWHNRAP